MTLNTAQREQTSKELKANYKASGLPQEAIQAALGLSGDQFDAAINLSPDSRRDTVWRLRDYLDEELRAQGKEPFPYSLL